MDKRKIITPKNSPNHPVVGNYFAGYSRKYQQTMIWYCFKHDNRTGFFLRNANDDTDVIDVSERAINGTFWPAEDQGESWFVGKWGKRYHKTLLSAIAKAI